MKYIYSTNGTSAYKPRYEKKKLSLIETHNVSSQNNQDQETMPESPKEYLKNMKGYSFTKDKKESFKLASYAILGCIGFFIALTLICLI